ncbi:MAG: hypothetical protein AAB883_02005 [Patescibacteria group bacterium]
MSASRLFRKHPRRVLISALVVLILALVAAWYADILPVPVSWLSDSAVRTRYTLPDGSSFVLPGRHEAVEFPYPSTIKIEAISHTRS